MCLTQVHCMQCMMTSEDGSNGLEIDFNGLMGCEKLKKKLMDHEFLLMVVRQTHYNCLGGVCLQINHV